LFNLVCRNYVIDFVLTMVVI